MQIINIIDGILMVCNLVFAAFILLRLLIPLRIKGTFIVSFYVVSIFLTVMRLVEVSKMIADEQTLQWEFVYRELDFFRVCAIIATVSFFTLGLFVISTMFQIGVSIQVMIKDVESVTAKRILRLFNGFLIILQITFLVFIYLARSQQGAGRFAMKPTLFWLYTITFSLLSIIFTLTIIYLSRVMRRINDGENFTREKRSIFLQFLFFLIAFMSRAIFFGYEIY